MSLSVGRFFEGFYSAAAVGRLLFLVIKHYTKNGIP